MRETACRSGGRDVNIRTTTTTNQVGPNGNIRIDRVAGSIEEKPKDELKNAILVEFGA